MENTFEVGDRVAYARTFLRSVGLIDYDSASGRGTITEKLAPNFVRVRWDSGDRDIGVNVANLWPADKIHLEPV